MAALIEKLREYSSLLDCILVHGLFVNIVLCARKKRQKRRKKRNEG